MINEKDRAVIEAFRNDPKFRADFLAAVEPEIKKLLDKLPEMRIEAQNAQRNEIESRNH